MNQAQITNARKSWSQKDVDFIKRHIGLQSYQQIADLMGRTRHAVYMKASKIGINPGGFGESHYRAKYSDHDVELCRALYQEGIKPRVIAEKMEMPVTSVYSIVYYRVRKRITPTAVC
ncbi:hypothetical protein D3C79_225780 [compost metagenome]